MSTPVDTDPFWSVVRRKHPDIDIVVLSPSVPAPTASTLPARAPEPFERLQHADAEELWDRLVGHGMPQRTSRWIPGPTTNSIRHTVTFTLEGLGATAGMGHLREAGDLLSSDGWHVFVPPSGAPRVIADRPGELGTEDLLFGYTPQTGRMFARLTSTGLTVDAETARTLIGSAA